MAVATNRRYPHLLPPDVPVWEAHLRKYRDTYTQIVYDVRVGRGRDAPQGYPDNLRKMALDLSMRRIDAVAFTPTHIDLIEVTNHAGLKAVGQMVAYPVLYRATFFPDLPLHPLLVAGDLLTDVKIVLDTLNIDYLLYPHAKPR